MALFRSRSRRLSSDRAQSRRSVQPHFEGVAAPESIPTAHDFYNNATYGVQSVNAEGVLINVNDVELGWLGYSRDEVVGRLKLIDLIAPQDRTAFQVAFAKIVRDGVLRDFQFELTRKDGSTFPVLANANAVRDANRTFLMCQFTLLDISDLKRVERELLLIEDIHRRKASEDGLRESEARLRTITDNMPAFIAYMDKEQRYRFANKIYEDWMGKSREQIYGRSVREVEGEASYEQVRAGIKAVLAGKKTTFERDLRVVGVPRDVQVTYIPHFGAGREVVGYYVLVYDITAQKAAEQALARSEAQFRTLAESSPLGVFYSDRDGRGIYTNRRWQELTGTTLAETLGNGLNRALHEEDRASVVEAWQQAVREESEFSKEFRWRRGDGAVRWVHARAKPSRLNDGSIAGYVGIMEDITERRQAQDELMHSREALRALSASLQALREEERRRVVRELNDELSQELAALKIELHRLKAKLDDPAQAVKNIDGMLDQVAGIVASTKRLSVNLRPSTLDQLGLVAALEWLTQEFSRYSGIPCTLRVEDDESAIPEPYATAVFRVAQEGLSNVERHAAATDVTVDLLERNGRVLLRISDNGKGITDADQRKKNCLGILSMRERAHGLSGEFSVTGRPQAGTVLEVALPVKNVEN